MPIGFFITGTDTGIGKTTVSCALLHAFAAQGRSVIGMKPVAAGCENSFWQDVEHLKAASNISLPQSLINPYAFDAPIAPHIAAQHTGVRIDPEVIRQSCEKLQSVAEVTIVEGVGGFRVPLSSSGVPGKRYDTGDLAGMLGLPVILVVGIRLGCLNHALLTARAIESAGLKLAGWVANTIDPTMLQLEANLQTLTEWLDCPLLGVLPFQEQLDVRQLAGLMDLSRLE
ncbi:MAG: dethiobiotin synthase [Burkholderiales bacterium]|nr:dethiobiotin synthase [Burkholderiales bacterium]